MIVWLNRDVPLYMVRVRRPDGKSIAPLVLTDLGPAGAAEIASHQFGDAHATEKVIFPFISDEMAVVEQIVKDPSFLTKTHGLKLYRVVLAHDTGDKVLFIWSTKGVKYARHLAEQSIPGGEWRNTYVVTNPVIVVDAERALEPA